MGNQTNTYSSPFDDFTIPKIITDANSPHLSQAAETLTKQLSSELLQICKTEKKYIFGKTARKTKTTETKEGKEETTVKEVQISTDQIIEAVHETLNYLSMDPDNTLAKDRHTLLDKVYQQGKAPTKKKRKSLPTQVHIHDHANVNKVMNHRNKNYEKSMDGKYILSNYDILVLVLIPELVAHLNPSDIKAKYRTRVKRMQHINQIVIDKIKRKMQKQWYFEYSSDYY